jgi:hypothetical protein
LFQAAHAFCQNPGAHLNLNQQSLSCPRNAHDAEKFFQIQVWRQVNERDFKWEFSTVANILVNYKTNVQVEKIA